MAMETPKLSAPSNKAAMDVAEQTFDLAIIGGGFSGLCTAYHLLAHDGIAPSFRCVIIEPGEQLGAGVAYRTDSPHHLLNVRAKGMSMIEAEPASFSSWLREMTPEFTSQDFVPRGLYRRYINTCLERIIRHRPLSMLTVLRDQALAIVPKGDKKQYHLQLESGSIVHARMVVLALGNLPPKTFLDNGLLHSPWSPVADYTSLGNVAIVGSGLTALDVILEAEALGFSGQYRVISPKGQFPRTHREPHTPVPADLRLWAERLAALPPKLPVLLRAFQLKRKSGVHWEHLVDSLRKHSPGIWSRLTTRDQRRFLRRLRPFWNVHLHRSCCKSMEIINSLIASGRLEQIPARVVAVEKLPHDGETAVRLHLHQCGSAASTLETDLAFNGAGLFSDVLCTDSPLLEQLLADGLAQPDYFRMGVRVNPLGQLVDAEGRLQPELFTIGTLRRGAELECTSVPEIRRQILRMVNEIVRLLE